MSRPDGAHTHGPQGGGGLVLAVIVAAALVGAASAAASALASLLVTLVIVLVGLAVLGGIGLLVYRVRRGRLGMPIAAPVVSRLPPAEPQRLKAPQPLAIEPPRNELHLHFHGMCPGEAADAIRQAFTRKRGAS